jgi:hypothetical protein
VPATGAGPRFEPYNRIRGTYATENRYLLHTVLRDEWGFQGYVQSGLLVLSLGGCGRQRRHGPATYVDEATLGGGGSSKVDPLYTVPPMDACGTSSRPWARPRPSGR